MQKKFLQTSLICLIGAWCLLMNPLMTNPCVAMEQDDKQKPYVLINQTKAEFAEDDLNYDICPSPYPKDAIFVFKDDPLYDFHKANADAQGKK